MKYRLALDLGSTSLGWALVLLNANGEPCAIIRAGVRIFPDGRNPKDGSSLAVTRRNARAMRRRRDRLLKRKARMMRLLVEHGFFPAADAARKALEKLNPYELRAKGLDAALTPSEFARALFHLNQRRGFKSNRRTDKNDNDSGALKSAIANLRQQLDASGTDSKARTVGELLWKRMQAGQDVRAKNKSNKPTKVQYELYVDRAMVEVEFDALWARQEALNQAHFTEAAREALKDCLLHQRNLRPVKPGRCTLEPDEPRAPLALPSQQRFRILQEVNHLRLLSGRLLEEALSLEQRDKLVAALEGGSKSFKTAIPTLLGLPGTAKFNLADTKRTELKGNATSMELSKKQFFGAAWHEWPLRHQDAVVKQLIHQESLGKLVKRLQKYCGLDEARAEHIAEKANLVPGYGSLSAKALAKILPAMCAEVITYDKAVQTAGYQHHSHISHAASTGEILPELPYYGEYLQRHVGFGTGKLDDPPEKRYGRIANPTVHIGLNQVRVVVNALIKRYGHPTEVIVEVARDLKQSQEQRRETQEQQTKNQRRNERIKQDIANAYTEHGFARSSDQIKRSEVEKWILWEELSSDVADRRCPYSGERIGAADVLSERVEIEHILPFSMSLDDSLNNKTVALRQANRVKGNRTPWNARADFAAQGWDYEGILTRAELMPRAKRQRFAADGYEKWLREDKDFLARALNDTRHLSRVAREYMSLVCPADTRVIPGRMTAELRRRFGLNEILSLNGEKNRNDHRHHAVDACVVAVTDQRLLKRFAQASADARGKGLDRLVETMPDPWKSYREHVRRAANAIWISHKPDHGYQGEMFDATIYGLRGPGKATYQQIVDGQRTRPILNREVVPFADAGPQSQEGSRHGELADGSPRPYMGLWSRSNCCIEIERQEDGQWRGTVLERYKAYQLVAQRRSEAVLRDRRTSSRGLPLVMRLFIDDTILLEIDSHRLLLKVLKINSTGAVTFVLHNETNIPKRYAAKLAAQKELAAGRAADTNALNDHFFQRKFSPESLRDLKARQVWISPIGDLRDPGFRG